MSSTLQGEQKHNGCHRSVRNDYLNHVPRICLLRASKNRVLDDQLIGVTRIRERHDAGDASSNQGAHAGQARGWSGL